MVTEELYEAAGAEEPRGEPLGEHHEEPREVAGAEEHREEPREAAGMSSPEAAGWFVPPRRARSSAVRPRCFLCGPGSEVFGSRQELMHHEEQQHEAAAFRCRTCRKQFRSSPALRKHAAVLGHEVSCLFALPGEVGGALGGGAAEEPMSEPDPAQDAQSN